MIAAIPADQVEGQSAEISVMYERSPDGSVRILSAAPVFHVRVNTFISPAQRTCLSCGAKTNAEGQLPCGH